MVTSTIQPMVVLPRKGATDDTAMMNRMAPTGVPYSLTAPMRGEMTLSAARAYRSRLSATVLPKRLVTMSANNDAIMIWTPMGPT